jgi:hypothetical protein
VHLFSPVYCLATHLAISFLTVIYRSICSSNSAAPYAVLIDRRDASWSNVKQVLISLQGCKLELASILVIRPGGLHRIISEATVRFLDLGFAENTNVKFLKGFDQALAHIEPEFISTVSILEPKMDK